MALLIDKIAYLLKALGALLVNVLVPGAGFMAAGYYRAGITIQASLVGSLIICCWSRCILTPTGCKVLLILMAIIYIYNTLLLAFNISKERSSWTLRNLCLALAFSTVCLSSFFAGFESKQYWLGVHINFVPSISMLPTLHPGDFIVVDTWAYHHLAPKINDIVTFSLPLKNDFTVKRISHWPEQQLINNDLFYVLGDNPPYSRDSRHIGGITAQQINGKVRLVLISLDKKGRLNTDSAFSFAN